MASTSWHKASESRSKCDDQTTRLGIRQLTTYSELGREKMWSRIHLIPLLQAEEDRDLVRRHLADQAREKELLGDNFKVYNSDRYVHFAALSAGREDATLGGTEQLT
jgi:hypothetical protein